MLSLWVFSLIPSAPLLATDCTSTNIDLTSQDQVNEFQDTYGGGGICGTITGNLTIESQDIVDLSPLADLTRVNGRLRIAMTSLTSLEGLSGLNSIGSVLEINNNLSLVNLEGLASLSNLGSHLVIMFNEVLESLDGLSALESVGGGLTLRNNPGVKNVDGLAGIAHWGGNLIVGTNYLLANLDGLAGTVSVGGGLSVFGNSNLADCSGIGDLIDEVDDAELGPGPGEGGVPDIGDYVDLNRNAAGCNSIREILLGITAFRINPGLNDAWYSPDTDGQGFLITVFPDKQQLFVAWFTYDTQRPLDDVSAMLGEPGHRWLTALGPHTADTAILQIFLTEGGVFDSGDPASETSGPIGTLSINWDECENAWLHYSIDEPAEEGWIDIIRVAPDNIPLCEALSMEE